jgi:hypothetical protein
MPALQLHARRLLSRTEHVPSASAPFASPAGFLDPSDSHPVTDFSACDTWAHSDHFANWFMPKNPRERAWNMAKSLVDIGIANSACVHLDEDLIGAGHWLRDFAYFPSTIYSRGHRSFHLIPPLAFDVEGWKKI